MSEKLLMSTADKKTRVSILIPNELFKKLEDEAKKSFLGKSSWIIQAVSEKINKEELEKRQTMKN